jgi:predicted nucleic acid-binding protein
LGRDLLVPGPVLVEVDQLMRARLGSSAARAFLAAIASGEHSTVAVTPGLLREAVRIDARYADLDLGFVDACVMAVADREHAPVLTFDFRHFRATRPTRGFWRFVVDEARYAEATGRKL